MINNYGHVVQAKAKTEEEVSRALSDPGRRRLAGKPAEYGIAGLAGERRIIVEEEAHDVAGGVEAFDRLIDRVDDLRIAIDLHAAEREGDAAGDRIGAKRRRLDPAG